MAAQQMGTAASEAAARTRETRPVAEETEFDPGHAVGGHTDQQKGGDAAQSEDASSKTGGTPVEGWTNSGHRRPFPKSRVCGRNGIRSVDSSDELRPNRGKGQAHKSQISRPTATRLPNARKMTAEPSEQALRPRPGDSPESSPPKSCEISSRIPRSRTSRPRPRGRGRFLEVHGHALRREPGPQCER